MFIFDFLLTAAHLHIKETPFEVSDIMLWSKYIQLLAELNKVISIGSQVVLLHKLHSSDWLYDFLS